MVIKKNQQKFSF